MNRRMDRSQFHIGTYSLRPYARTEKHIRELAECGIDFVVGVEQDTRMLDLFLHYGIGAVVNRIVPGWFGGTGENAGTMAEKNAPDDYRTAADKFRDHPAIWGIDAGDEPSSLDFPHLGRVMALVDKQFENQFAYMNLYASYGMRADSAPGQAARELGCGDYGQYLRSYCEAVQTDYLCFDHYMYTTDWHSLVRDLKTAAEVCKEYNRDLWIVLQVNSRDPAVYLSEKQLRLQAYTAMAFGVTCISWACYTAGWWHNQVLDRNGEKTEQYEKLKRVNGHIRGLSEAYMRYRWVASQQLGASDEAAQWGQFREISVGHGHTLLAGHMEQRDGSGAKALFLAAPDGEDVVTLRFRSSGPVHFQTGEAVQLLTLDAEAMYTLSIPACGGGLLTCEENGPTENGKAY